MGKKKTTLYVVRKKKWYQELYKGLGGLIGGGIVLLLALNLLGVVSENYVNEFGEGPEQTLDTIPISQEQTAAEITAPSTSAQGSRVCDRTTGKCLPQVGQLYACPEGFMKLRKTISTASGSLNRYQMHGNTHYYAKGWISWFGQDFISGCGDKTVVAPISGTMRGDPDGANKNGSGLECSISGTGAYKGMYIKILHLAKECTSQARTVNRGERISSETNHTHVIVLWGTGTYSINAKDVPFTLLLPANVKVGSYTAGSYVEGATPSNDTFDKWMVLR